VLYLPALYLPALYLPALYLPALYLPALYLPALYLPALYLPALYLPALYLPALYLPALYLPSLGTCAKICSTMVSAFTPSACASEMTSDKLDCALSQNNLWAILFCRRRANFCSQGSSGGKMATNLFSIASRRVTNTFFHVSSSVSNKNYQEARRRIREAALTKATRLSLGNLKLSVLEIGDWRLEIGD